MLNVKDMTLKLINNSIPSLSDIFAIALIAFPAINEAIALSCTISHSVINFTDVYYFSLIGKFYHSTGKCEVFCSFLGGVGLVVELWNFSPGLHIPQRGRVFYMRP